MKISNLVALSSLVFPSVKGFVQKTASSQYNPAAYGLRSSTAVCARFTPDIVFPDKGRVVDFWSTISSTDRVGLTIDNLKKGDVVHIDSLSGIASFEKSSNKVLAGFVAIAGGILQDGLSLYTTDKAKATNEAIGKQTQVLTKELSKEVNGKKRDGYGQDPGSGDFAKGEGGVIMCMPTANGAVYAAPENNLKSGAKKNGRLAQYHSDNINRLNCWFPSRKDGGTKEKVVQSDGPLHVLAFDKQFSDNGGSYTCKIIVTRPSPTDGISDTELVQMLKDQRLKFGI